MKMSLHKYLEILKSLINNIKINKIDGFLFPIFFLFGFFYYPYKDYGMPLSLASRFNIPSLGFGMSRGIASFARLNFLESFNYNWFAPVFMIYLLFLTFWNLSKLLITMTPILIHSTSSHKKHISNHLQRRNLPE